LAAIETQLIAGFLEIMYKLVIQHHSERGRFSAEVDGYGMELDYQRDGEQLIFSHTGTAPELRGRGLAALLVEHALLWAAPQALQLVPACSFVATYLQRHARWQRLQELPAVQQVLNGWFGPPGSDTDQQIRALWFEKSDRTDAEITARFELLIAQALAGELCHWEATPLGRLALILLLDQFTRNSFRGHARAFAGDAFALPVALTLLDSGGYTKLELLQRWFVLMPLEHAEDRVMQQRSVAEFEALAAGDARLAGALDYARRHRDVIERFGRFPHRNAILGRVSTAEELAYLAQPGSGF
jgi:uncharacterized protein (DUF924 family)/predicted GNAT family acetyltransferase